MRSVIYSMGVSLDGYIVGPDSRQARPATGPEPDHRLPAAPIVRLSVSKPPSAARSCPSSSTSTIGADRTGHSPGSPPISRVPVNNLTGKNTQVGHGHQLLVGEATADQTEARRSLGGPFRAQEVEATSGFEPLNRGFADLPLRPLGYVASDACRRGPAVRSAAPRDVWLPLEDSNLGSRIQSPLSYH